jgi:predicted GNAT family N-acyltransferase
VTYIISQPVTKEEFKQYYHLRWKLLRAPWGQVEGTEKDTIEDECFHLIASDSHGNDQNHTDNRIINNMKVIGVARLQFNSSIEAQIRYMAVDENNENNGVGRELVHTIEQRAIETCHKKIVLDAREPAIGFYQKSGYQITGKSYLLFDSIQHYRMTKTL